MMAHDLCDNKHHDAKKLERPAFEGEEEEEAQQGSIMSMQRRRSLSGESFGQKRLCDASLVVRSKNIMDRQKHDAVDNNN